MSVDYGSPQFSPESRPEPLRIGLIGAGGIAESAHIPAIRNLPGRVRLVAVADPARDRAEALAAPFDAEPYEDYRALVERGDVDAVIIATPERWHADITAAAATNGKHVLCEKPIAHTLEDADRMLRVTRDHGVRLMIGHSRRFTARYQALRALLDDDAIGTVALIRENERRPRPASDTGGYWSPGHWTADPAISLGVSLTNGIHEADLSGWLAGSEPVRIYAETKILRPGGRVPDFITWTITFANGVLATSEIVNGLPPSYPAYHQLEVYGSGGALRAKDHDMQSATFYGREGATNPISYSTLLHQQDTYTRQLKAFADAVDTRGPLPVTPEEARAALRLALAAQESAERGRAVTLATPPEPPSREPRP